VEKKLAEAVKKLADSGKRLEDDGYIKFDCNDIHSCYGRRDPLCHNMDKEVKYGEAMLNHALCRRPVWEEDESEEESGPMRIAQCPCNTHAQCDLKKEEMVGENFPYSFSVVDNEEAWDDPVFPTYRGPVYFHMSDQPDPLVHRGEPWQPALTPRTLCQAVKEVVEYDPWSRLEPQVPRGRQHPAQGDQGPGGHGHTVQV